MERGRPPISKRKKRRLLSRSQEAGVPGTSGKGKEKRYVCQEREGNRFYGFAGREGRGQTRFADRGGGENVRKKDVAGALCKKKFRLTCSSGEKENIHE